MSRTRPASYVDRLGTRIAATGTALCLGVDPDPPALSSGGGDPDAVERACRIRLEAALPVASAVKFNTAFFEAWGSAGLDILRRVRRSVPREVPVILDAKRSDIPSTTEKHAAALFDHLDADAVTASPYLGADGIAPLLARRERFVYVLCRTSNAGAAEFQSLSVAADGESRAPVEPLFLRVARRAVAWNERFGTVGLVVGATAPAELRAIRDVAPTLPFLVPGLGAQGGDLAAVLDAGPARPASPAQTPDASVAGGLLLVNVSRGIAAVPTDDDPRPAIEAAAREWSERLSVLR